MSGDNGLDVDEGAPLEIWNYNKFRNSHIAKAINKLIF